MLSTQRKLSIGYFLLTIRGLGLLQVVFFAPQREKLSYRDFKTLLKAGKVVDLLLSECARYLLASITPASFQAFFLNTSCSRR